MTLSRRIIAESLGTAFLLDIVVGSGIMLNAWQVAMLQLPC